MSLVAPGTREIAALRGSEELDGVSQQYYASHHLVRADSVCIRMMINKAFDHNYQFAISKLIYLPVYLNNICFKLSIVSMSLV